MILIIFISQTFKTSLSQQQNQQEQVVLPLLKPNGKKNYLLQ